MIKLYPKMLHSYWNLHRKHNLLTNNPKKILPPESLYIYYFQGRVFKENLPSVPHFLGDWEEEGDSFLFFSQPAPAILDHILHRQPELSLLEEYEVPYLEWQGGEIGVFEVGNLRFVPFWKRQHLKTDKDRDIVFDPGVVFGTGNHATTRDCLQAMDYVFAREEVCSALDIGSGSGVLSLAAAKWGTKRVLALDNNPLAALTTRKNINLNNLEDNVLAIQAKGEEHLHVHTELLLANIHLDVMRRLVRDAGFKSKKWCILSGLMSSGAAEVREMLLKQDIQVVSNWISEEIWHTFLLKNNNY